MHQEFLFYGNTAMCVVMFAQYLWYRRQPNARREGLERLTLLSICYGLLAFGIWLDNTHFKYSDRAQMIVFPALVLLVVRTFVLEARARKRRPAMQAQTSEPSVNPNAARVYNDWAKPDPE